jgi:glycine cleavage system H protein
VLSFCLKVEGGVGIVGITGHAADALGDIVFVELPDVGSEFSKGETFGSVESVKAASDVYLPVAGEVIETNGNLEGNPSIVNESPVEDGWFVKIKVSDESELKGLMDKAKYDAFLKTL